MQLKNYIQYFLQFDDITSVQQQIPLNQLLSDGIVIHSVLQKIPDIEFEINQKPQTFTHAFSNLKLIFKNIEQYWSNVLDKPLSTQQIDLVQIAKHSKTQQIQKLAELVVKTAVQSSNKNYFIEKILSTSAQTQELFMNFFGQSKNNRIDDSPRRQRQKRLFDKIIELDHENDKLQSVIGCICDEKLEIQNKNKNLQEKIKEKDVEIEKLHHMLEEYMQTPTKKKEQPEEDLQIVEKLKNKIISMSKQHEIQLSRMRQDVQLYLQKMQRLNQMELQIESYQDKMNEATEALNKVSNLQVNNRKYLVTINQNQQKIFDLKQKLDFQKLKINQMEVKQLQYISQIERLNIKVQQVLANKVKINRESEIIIPHQSLQRSLSEQCPEIAHEQVEKLMETNRYLRIQLDRNQTTLKQYQSEVKRLQKIQKDFENIEDENKRLTKILSDMSSYRGQQNELIVGCMYEMRNILQKSKSQKFSDKIKNVKKKALGNFCLN